jgi:hypothetical protein
MFNWLRKNWKKSVLLLTLGYGLHLFVEAVIVTNLLALVGISVPVLV